MIVFDVTKRETFDKAVKWIDEVWEFCDEEIKIGLIGNKCDLVEEWEVTKEEVEKIA